MALLRAQGQREAWEVSMEDWALPIHEAQPCSGAGSDQLLREGRGEQDRRWQPFPRRQLSLARERTKKPEFHTHWMWAATRTPPS